MNNQEVENFCKSLKIDDIVKANYIYGERELITMVVFLDDDYKYTEFKCIMDTYDKGELIGRNIQIHQLIEDRWKFEKL